MQEQSRQELADPMKLVAAVQGSSRKTSEVSVSGVEAMSLSGRSGLEAFGMHSRVSGLTAGQIFAMSLRMLQIP